MQENSIKVLLWSAFWLINNLSAILAAPQQAPVFDVGILKIALDTENGFAVRKDVNIDSPFFKVRKTGEIGFGSPMVSATDSDSDEDSDEDQSTRKKRAAMDDKSGQQLNLRRKKRAPCYGAYRTTPIPPVTDDEVEARRRRNIARKLMQTKRKAKGAKAKSKRQGRRRRQAEIENFNEIQDQNVGNTFRDQIDQTLQRVHNMWESIVRATEQLVQTVKKSFNSAANSITQTVKPNGQKTEGAEMI